MTGTHNHGQMNDDALGLLAAEIRACTACPLHRSARQAVPGEGSGESGIFFLGEAPGYNEDTQGRPFVGAAGHLLDELLAGVGLDRSKVFITNVVRHRPPENRDPLPDEVAACDMWLKRHLEVLKPRVIVTLGRHAMYKFFPTESISRVHGKLRRTAEGLVVFPMYHPAAALHQPALRSALVADMSALATYLETVRPAAKEREEERPVVQTTLFSD
jgi:uracil-DNA glycosylase